MDLEQWRAYLRQCTGVNKDTLSFMRLEGGYLNSTIRLTLKSKIKGIGSISDLAHGTTLVLKHYPPYMYAWPDAPLSNARAKAEVDALRLIHTDPSLKSVFDTLDATVPRILHFDEHEKVAWMEDLGQHKTLEDYLQPEHSDLGRRIGALIAAIQLATLPLPKILPAEPPAGPLAALEHEERMRTLLNTHSDAEELMTRLRMRDAPIIGLPHRDAPEDEICLGVGDIWPTSFLVMNDTEKPKFAIIDWEFFGPMHPASEIATLVGRLYLAYTSKGLDPVNASPMSMVDAYLAAFRASKYAYITDRPSWVQRARAAWARVLLNAAHNLVSEGKTVTNSPAPAASVQEAVQSLRGHDANPLLSTICGNIKTRQRGEE